MTKKLIIIRGLPSSGKTTLAIKKRNHLMNIGSVVMIATDDFFTIDNVYHWDSNFLSEAHSWNYFRFVKHVFNKVEYIILHNTATTFWEIEKYVKFAIKHGYEIEVCEPDTPWKYDVDELTKRNTHGVPKETIQKMLDRMESTDMIRSAILELKENIK